MRLPHKTHAALGECARDFVRAISRAIRRDDYFQKLAGIVQRQSIFKLCGKVAFFIESRDDQTDGGLKVTAPDFAWTQLAHDQKQEGITGVCITERRRA